MRQFIELGHVLYKPVQHLLVVAYSCRSVLSAFVIGVTEASQEKGTIVLDGQSGELFFLLLYLSRSHQRAAIKLIHMHIRYTPCGLVSKWNN